MRTGTTPERPWAWKRIGVFAVLLLATALAVYVPFHFGERDIDAMVKGPLPEARLNLAAGEHQVFLIGHFWHGARFCDCPAAQHAIVEITGPDGQAVPVASPAVINIWHFGEQVGVELATVTLPESGPYVVHTDYSDAESGDQIAFGAFSVRVWPFVPAIALFAACLLYLMFADPFSRKPRLAKQDRAAAVAEQQSEAMLASIRVQLDSLNSQFPDTVESHVRDYLDACLKYGSITEEQHGQLLAERLV